MESKGPRPAESYTKLPLVPVSLDAKLTYLSDVRLADPSFGVPGYIDIMLSVMYLAV